MIMAQIENQIRYVTNAAGETTDVLVPIKLWQQLISSINSDNVSSLAWIDEQEPKAQILADLRLCYKQQQDKLPPFQTFGTTVGDLIEFFY